MMREENSSSFQTLSELIYQTDFSASSPEEKIKNLQAMNQLLVHLIEKINIDISLQDFINSVLKILKSKLSFDGANIVLYHEEKNTMETFLLDPSLYESRERYEKVRLILNREFPVSKERWMDIVCLDKREIHYPSFDPETLALLSEKERDMVQFLGYSAVYMLPIYLDEKKIGTLIFYNLREPLALSNEEKTFARSLTIILSRAINNSQIFNEIKQQKKIIQEKNANLLEALSFAKKIQQNMMPEKYPNIPGIGFASIYNPIEQLGGDFYDFLMMREPDQLGIFISDVSGHGVPAALITIMIKTLISTSGWRRASPEVLFQYINEKVNEKINNNFVTAFYALYLAENKTMNYVKAGHCSPYLIRNGQISLLEGRGKPLGMTAHSFFEAKTIQLQSGDKLLFYTDGLTESLNERDEEFEEYLPQILLENADQKIDDFLQSIYGQVLLHRKGLPFEDDICLVAMQVE